MTENDLRVDGIDQEGIRRLQHAEFVVGLELTAPGRSAGDDVVFVTELADHVALDGEGVVRDFDAFRMFLPGGWRVDEPLGDIDPREHIEIHVVADEDGPAWIHTHGLVKFGKPELEVYDIPPDLRDHMAVGMLDLAAYLLGGAVIEPGHTLGDPSLPVRVLEGGRDREHWEDTAVLELAGEDALRAWFGS